MLDTSPPLPQLRTSTRVLETTWTMVAFDFLSLLAVTFLSITPVRILSILSDIFLRLLLMIEPLPGFLGSSLSFT